MESSGDQYWARSKYPGHPSSTGSVHSSRPTSPFAEPDDVSTPSIKAPTPAPWYHAVTDDREQDSIMSRLENASLHSFLQSQSIRVDQAADASSTAFSYSPPASTTAPSVTNDHHSPLGASFEPSTNGLNDISRSSTPWSRSGYPRQANTATDPSIGHPSPLTRPDPNHDQDDDEDEDSEYSPTTTPERTRTLRRIPRSRRIMSPVQLDEDEQSTTGSTSGPWKRRQSYPVHSVTSDSTSQHLATPPPEMESHLADSHSLHSIHLEDSEVPKQSSPPSVAWSQKGYPLQSSTAGSATGPVSSPPSDHGSHPNPEYDPKPEPEADVEPVSDSHPDQPAQPDQAAKEKPQWNRRASYPLQVAATHSSLTPPQSSTEKDSASDAVRAPNGNLPPEQPYYVKRTTAGSTTSSRSRKSLKSYPLQSPAEHAGLRRSPTPPSSRGNESEPDMETNPATNESTDHSHEETQDAPKDRTFRRQRYPLHVQASTPATRPQTLPGKQPDPKPVEASKPESTIEISTEQSPGSDQTTAPNRLFRRPSYPLATLASTANEKSAQTPPPSYSSPAKSESDGVSKPSAEQPEKTKSEAPEKDVTSPRQAYPVQEPVKAPTVRIESPHEEKPSTLKPREKEIAIKVVDQWRRGSYPLQSPQNISPFERPITPIPPEDEEAERARSNQRKIHIPKNMRALKDAEAPYSGRTIVILLDGTGDKFDDDNSNIVHLVSALKKGDLNQVTYYQAGIGTYSDGGLSTGFAAAADMAVGSGLGLHVRDAYHYIMHSYKEGDKICIFGFSRGAYTARCLAGMIHKVGLLPPRNIQQIYFAYEFYANDTAKGWEQSADFKRTFSIDVNVYLLGCFDSVASVGFIPRQLPLSSTPTSKPRYFRHAMALDERRAKFKVCRHQTKHWDDIIKADNHKSGSLMRSSLHRHKDQNDQPPPIHEATSPAHQQDPSSPPPGYHKPRRFSTYYHPNVTDEEYHELKAHDEAFETDVLEVWFAGAHADVGGGAVPNVDRHKLAQIPLRWMIRQCFECDTGIIFKTKVLAEHGLDVHTLWPEYTRLKAPVHGVPPSIFEKFENELPPRSTRRDKLVAINKKNHDGEHMYHLQSPKDEDWTPELVEDFYDALCKINDQLIDAPSWWILEFLPVEYKVPVSPGVVHTRTGPNWGRYRGVDDLEPNVHWTVFHRMQQLGYKIQARTAPNTKWKTCV